MFEKFTLVGAKSLVPRVHLDKNGKICFNVAFMRKYKVSSAAGLYYDKSEELIGVKFGKASEDFDFKVCSTNTAMWISAKSFLAYYDIPYPRNLAIIESRDKPDMLVLKLAE